MDLVTNYHFIFEDKKRSLRASSLQPRRRRRKFVPKVRWKVAGSRDKIASAALALTSIADTHAYTLTYHLNDKVVDRIGRDKSARYHFDEFGRLLTKVLGHSVAYFLVVEGDLSEERIHVHGGVAVASVELERVEVAVKNRFTKGLSYWGHNKPVHACLMDCAVGWADYCCKSAEQTVQRVGTTDIYAISQPLMQAAKNAYSDSRA